VTFETSLKLILRHETGALWMHVVARWQVFCTLQL